MSAPVAALRARAVVTLADPRRPDDVLRDAVVRVADGCIVGVEPWRAGSNATDLGDVLLLPGLINAHVHLELSGLRADARPTNFASWLLSVTARLPADERDREMLCADAARRGARECLRFGVTTVGDIAQRSAAVRAALRGGPLRVMSYGEALGIGQRRPRFEALLAAASDPTPASPTLRVGVSPHAPYTVDGEGYRACLRGGLPLATHLAETPDEARFLLDHGGPFGQLYARLGVDPGPPPRFDGGPIRWAKSLGLLDAPALLAHVNCCDDEELDLLAAGRASVVFCPRTHAFFGRPPHRWREMLRRGVNVAVGVDSRASAPDLNVLDDLRLLGRDAGGLSPGELLGLITTRAARALGLEHEVGAIVPGRRADLAAFPLDAANALDALLGTTCSPAGVWIDGRLVHQSAKAGGCPDLGGAGGGVDAANASHA